MAYSIEEWHAFIEDSIAERRYWLEIARASWNEINRQSGSLTNESIAKRRRTGGHRFPLHWSTYKIRQGLLYSRTPIPVGKDTTGGDDPTGRTAAINLERLAANLMRDFDFDSVMESCRNDFLVTDFGECRAFYSCEDVEETAKTRVYQVETPSSGDRPLVEPQYQTGDGKLIQTESLLEDEEGYYIESSKVIDVKNERVYLEHLLFTDIYVDPDSRIWGKIRRLAFGYDYTRDEFKEIFGERALHKLPIEENQSGGRTRKLIRVYEAWDSYEKKVVWFTDESKDFIKPSRAKDDDDYDKTDNKSDDLYGLEKFFPCPRPLLQNCPPDGFWPVPEYEQMRDILDDVHNIFGKIYELTKAIRPRFLFDSSVPELSSLVNETEMAGGLGVPNLAQTLAAGQGRLDNLVAYMPVGPMIEALGNMYTALEQRLKTYYELTGVSDLLRGQTTDPRETYGAQQLAGRYAMNRIAEGQRAMQEFARDSIELMCECALKNFSDEALVQYMVPQTLDAEDRDRFPAAVELLKNDKKRRFRIELETDSTVALNEEYDKAARVEVANALSAAIEKTAQTATQDKGLAIAELRILLHLVRGFRQGKLFEDEITAAINQTIERMELASQAEVPPDPEMLKVQIEQQKFQLLAGDQQLKARAAGDKLRFDYQSLQVEQNKQAIQSQKDVATYQLKLAELNLKNQELMLERAKLNLETWKEGTEVEMKNRMASLDEQIAISQAQLAQAAQSLDEQKVSLDMQERYMTEERLQMEAELKVMEAAKPVEAPEQAPREKLTVPIRDEMGNTLAIHTTEV